MSRQQLAADRRLHRVQVRRVPERGVARAAAGGPRPARTRVPVLHPAVGARAQAARHRVHEAAPRQGEHHPRARQGRHHDARRVRLLQEAGACLPLCPAASIRVTNPPVPPA